MFVEVDSEGNRYQLLQEITDHRKDRSAIPIPDGMIRSHNGSMIPKRTTLGWGILVEWKGGYSSCIPLKYLKASNPVEIAEYAAGNRLDVEPAFKWWLRDVIILRNRIISKVKDKYWRTTHKFEIRVPESVDEALAIDK